MRLSRVGALLLVGAAGAPLAGQRGSFPWSGADPAPALFGIRLGDSRARVDSILGEPSEVRSNPDNSGMLIYDARGLTVILNNERRVHAMVTERRGAALGGVRVGQTMRDVRARWGAVHEVDKLDSFYGAGTFVVLVRADDDERVTQLGLIAVETPQPYTVPDTTDVFRVAAGTWDWESAEQSCVDDPHTISFTPDRKFMILTSAKPDTADDGTITTEWRYEIRGHTNNSIRGFIIGEDRKTETGELVVWDLVLMSPDGYRWHRTDWRPGGYTGLVVRCRS